MSAELRGRLIRRGFVLAMTLAVIVVGLAAVAQAAVWRAQSAPLDRAPIGMSELDVQLAAELDRRDSLADQVSTVAGEIAVLRGAILTAEEGIAGDTDAATALETKLGSAKDKLDTLTKQLKAAKRRLDALNAAAARQAALNRAAAQQRTTSAADHDADPATSTKTSTRKTMTERILPAISVPAQSPTRPRPAVAPPLASPRAAARRNEAFLTTPARAGMLLGASAAIYAITLAGIAALQASDDAAVAARRQPWVDAIAAERVANDELEANLTSASDNATWLGGRLRRREHGRGGLPGASRRAGGARRGGRRLGGRPPQPGGAAVGHDARRHRRSTLRRRDDARAQHDLDERWLRRLRPSASGRSRVGRSDRRSGCTSRSGPVQSSGRTRRPLPGTRCARSSTPSIARCPGTGAIASSRR